MTERDFADLCNRMIERIDAITPRLIDSQSPSVKLRSALRTGWRLFLRSRTINYLRSTMLADLVRRGRITGWTRLSHSTLWLRIPAIREDVQSIIAELINPAFDFRTPKGTSNKTGLPEDFVGEVLSSLRDRKYRQGFESGNQAKDMCCSRGVRVFSKGARSHSGSIAAGMHRRSIEAVESSDERVCGHKWFKHRLKAHC